MSESKKDIVTLVTSRMCHDLINPVSAINNGLELLALAGGISSMNEEVALVQSSAESTAARIQFFRIAFGEASTERAVNGEELGRLAQQNIADARTDLIWQVEGNQDSLEAKLSMLLLMCARSAAPRGGLLKVLRSQDDWQIDLSAESIKTDDKLWARLAGKGEDAELTPATIQFELAYLFAKEFGAPLKINKRNKSLSVQFPIRTAWSAQP